MRRFCALAAALALAACGQTGPLTLPGSEASPPPNDADARVPGAPDPATLPGQTPPGGDRARDEDDSGDDE